MQGVIAVTGSSGFTGRYVVRALESRGYRVLQLSRTGNGGRACDLTSFASIQSALQGIKLDGLVHLAAESFVAQPDKARFYEISTVATETLLEAMVSTGQAPRKVIVASSANVYGRNAHEHTDESEVPAPVNHYAASKLAMEHMVANFFDRFEIIVTRAFNYTGPGQNGRFLIPKIVRHFRERRSAIELGNIKVARDYSGVEDMAACFCKLLESEMHSSVINLCSGEARSLESIVEALERLCAHRMHVMVNPAFVRVNEIPVLSGSPERLRQAIGFVPGFGDDVLRQMLETPETTA